MKVVGYEDNWWPFFHTDETGELSGIDITVAEKICKALDVQPVFIRKDNFNQLATSLNNGTGTGMFTDVPGVYENVQVFIRHAFFETHQI